MRADRMWDYPRSLLLLFDKSPKKGRLGQQILAPKVT
jgi:hypothetical protein